MTLCIEPYPKLPDSGEIVEEVRESAMIADVVVG
jgi:hypothetical protein